MTAISLGSRHIFIDNKLPALSTIEWPKDGLINSISSVDQPAVPLIKQGTLLQYIDVALASERLEAMQRPSAPAVQNKIFAISNLNNSPDKQGSAFQGFGSGGRDQGRNTESRRTFSLKKKSRQSRKGDRSAPDDQQQGLL